MIALNLQNADVRSIKAAIAAVRAKPNCGARERELDALYDLLCERTEWDNITQRVSP